MICFPVIINAMSLAALFLPFLMNISMFNDSLPPRGFAASSSVHSSAAVNRTKMLQLVNEARAKGCKCGTVTYNAVPPLDWNEQLEQAAQNHVNDMYRKKYFSHTASDGSNAGIRMERAGYKWMTYGENIATGFVNEKEVVEGWLKSPGHCKNLMSKNFREMGVARNGNLWTQTFGRKL
jgi:uncharacterized protein YkwD